MRSFEAMHNDYLDPDKHGVFDDEPYCPKSGCDGICDEYNNEVWICDTCGAKFMLVDGCMENDDDEV